MSTPQRFTFESSDVRVLDVAGDPWFVLADLCRVLDLSNPSMVADRVDPDALSTAEVIDSMGRTQQARTVSESGMYEVIFLSRKPDARAFKRWVTHEVLPTIRRTGQYAPTTTQPVPTSFAEALELAAAEVRRREAAEAHALAATRQVAALEAPAASWQALASSDGDYSVEQAAKILSRDPHIEIGRDRLFELLRELRWVFRSREHGMRRPWAAYQSAIQTGRLVHRARSHAHPHTGATVLDAPQVRVTAKGLDDLRRHLGSTSPLLQLEEVDA